jgi:hypothetical protein
MPPTHWGQQYGYLHAELSQQYHGWLDLGVAMNAVVRADHTSSTVSNTSSNRSTDQNNPYKVPRHRKP